ncbi:hypothetical protein EYF80_049975 [Liparis tanakae]|uniref:Uncharacterized protein n=1 Tax=Liparis tanakae TaxID=230148 RepID=A0A4Z2FFZ4_9TELE|nr:hypothetical protein EYF80_049975 [Liparis tanakae]
MFDNRRVEHVRPLLDTEPHYTSRALLTVKYCVAYLLSESSPPPLTGITHFELPRDRGFTTELHRADGSGPTETDVHKVK